MSSDKAILSTRVKEAIKTGLAMVIVYGVAMQMGWDKPYWAGFTVVTINVLSAGVSLSRGIARSLGTLVGPVVALLIIGLFPQERWLRPSSGHGAAWVSSTRPVASYGRPR